AKALAAATVVTTKPLRRKRAMNPIFSAVMLVLFGGVGILAAIMILFWGFGTDPIGLGPMLPTALVPDALQGPKPRKVADVPPPDDVPEEGVPQDTSGDNAAGDNPDAPVVPESGTPDNGTAVSDNPPDNGTTATPGNPDPSAPTTPAPAAAVDTIPPAASTHTPDPFGEPKIPPPVAATPGETPADPFGEPTTTVLKPDATPNPFADPPPADPAAPATEPPAANPDTTATFTIPPDPFGVPETPADPAVTAPPAAVEPPVGSVATTVPPVAAPPTAGLTNDEKSFQAVIEKVGEDAAQFQSASTAAKKAKGAFYQSLAKLGEATAHVPADGSAPPTEHRPAVAEQVMTRIVTDRALANELGRLANLWLDHPARKEPGIILSGKVELIRPVGKLFEVVVLLPGSAGEAVRAPRSVPVLFSAKPSAVVGDDLLALGIVVDDPATKLKDYTGDARQVIWGASSMPLNKLAR
ncbi:MAG: hypothetical protein SGJ20_20235, partial [Planctomycetota bacterium]|nr:hypothetical protein [Planctomycetota bacterium]